MKDIYEIITNGQWLGIWCYRGTVSFFGDVIMTVLYSEKHSYLSETHSEIFMEQMMMPGIILRAYSSKINRKSKWIWYIRITVLFCLYTKIYCLKFSTVKHLKTTSSRWFLLLLDLFLTFAKTLVITSRLLSKIVK